MDQSCNDLIREVCFTTGSTLKGGKNRESVEKKELSADEDKSERRKMLL